MDESWRSPIGMPCLPRRLSTEEKRRSISGGSDTLEPEDFADVFGGPPRSVLTRKFSVDFTNSTSFYEEIFRPPEPSFQVKMSGRSSPVFRIPGRNERFYSDVFGSEDERRSRERSRPNSKSKSNSSSVLSSEDLSPLRLLNGGDVAFSSFASNLRPINVPCRWNSNVMMPEDHPKKQVMPAFPFCNPSSSIENQSMVNEKNENFRSSHFGFSQHVSSPETITLEPNSYRSVKISVDDLQFNSPSSAVSSLCQDPENKVGFQDNAMEEPEIEQEEDEVLSSYVIEIASNLKEKIGQTVNIDDAIAWAKEKFQKQEQSNETEETPNQCLFLVDHQTSRRHNMQSSEEEERNKWTTEEGTQQSEKDTKMELLDEEIRLWSVCKETNIRLLLSTLHQILWPNCGWTAVPLTSLIESSHVKKLYQKARLCLHPDKLQQRGATITQKYVAERAFSIIQDAWAAFISQDAMFK